MYLEFYHISKRPFQLTADPEFFWASEQYVKSLEVLQYGIEHQGGLSLLTGDAGSGKTTVVHALLRSLGKSVVAAMIPDPCLPVLDFYSLVAHAFNIPERITCRQEFHYHVSVLLQESGRKDKKVLLVIDEAQHLAPEVIREIDEILNLPPGETGGLNICLVEQVNDAEGLIKLIGKVFDHHVAVSYRLAPLTVDETAQYIHHRLRVAGATREIFTENALLEVHRYSAGYPGKINIICDFALFSGFTGKFPEITGEIVLRSAEKLQLFAIREDRDGIDRTGEHAAETGQRSFVKPAMAVVVVLATLGGGYGYYRNSADLSLSLPAEPTSASPLPTLETPSPATISESGGYSSLDAVAAGHELESETSTHEAAAGQPPADPALSPPDAGLPPLTSQDRSAIQGVDTAQEKFVVEAPSSENTEPDKILQVEEAGATMPEQEITGSEQGVEDASPSVVTNHSPVATVETPTAAAVRDMPDEADKKIPTSLTGTVSPSETVRAQEKQGPAPVAADSESRQVPGTHVVDGKSAATVSQHTVSIPPAGMEADGSPTPTANTMQRTGQLSSQTGKRTPALKEFLEAGAFFSRKFLDSGALQENRKHIRPTPASLQERKEETSSTPDPGDVIDWLLQKKEKKISLVGLAHYNIT